MVKFVLTVGGFGRRASDGGAHLQSYSTRVVSQPGSQEELKAVSYLFLLSAILRLKQIKDVSALFKYNVERKYVL